MDDLEFRVVGANAEDSEAASDASEVDEVLRALRALRRQVTIPVLQACLDGACDEILHLTATGAGEESFAGPHVV